MMFVLIFSPTYPLHKNKMEVTCGTTGIFISGQCYGACPAGTTVIGTDLTVCYVNKCPAGTTPYSTVPLLAQCLKSKVNKNTDGTCPTGSYLMGSECLIVCPIEFTDLGTTCMMQSRERTKYMPSCRRALYVYDSSTGTCAPNMNILWFLLAGFFGAIILLYLVTKPTSSSTVMPMQQQSAATHSSSGLPLVFCLNPKP
jgi:hypothetical protein